MPLFKFIFALYQFHHQTLPITKIDWSQIQFREYVSTGTEPEQSLVLEYKETKVAYGIFDSK